MDDQRPFADEDRARREGLPAHEVDDDRTTGGGILSQGGTTVDRGTGTLSGTAQHPDEESYGDQDLKRDPEEEDPAIPLRTG